MTNCPGIGDTTPQSLGDRWVEESGIPSMFTLGYGYYQMQVLFDAIERAGTLNGPAVNDALRATDINTLLNRITYNDDNFALTPAALMQWQKAPAESEFDWVSPTILSRFDFFPVEAEPIFPIPYK